MFGIGLSEILVVALLVLLCVGPRQLPELMRQFGRIFVRVRRMGSEVRSTFDSVIRDAEQELDLEARLKEELKKSLTSDEPDKNDEERK